MKLKQKFLSLLILSLLSTSFITAQEAFIGEIRIFAGGFAPAGWAFCDGQIISIAQNEALFSLLGTSYGGNGRTSFGLPDLRGRVVVGPRQGASLTSYSVGHRGGVETVRLSENQLPAHSHGVNIDNNGTVSIPINTMIGGEDEASPGSGVLANTGADRFSSEVTAGARYSGAPIAVTGIAATTTSIGNGTAIENRQPYIAINYIICMDGIYPSRN